MVLYHAITVYHVLEFIVYHLINHSGEKSVCLLTKNMMLDDKFSRDLVRFGFFSEVVQFYDGRIPPIKESLYENVDNMVKKCIPHIEDFDEINIAGAQFYFTYWLIHNKIKFNFWEEASGRLTDFEALRESVIKSGSDLQDEIAMENNMYDGNNPIVHKRYCNFAAQSADFDRNNVVDFNVTSELNKLSAECITRILNFFEVPSNLDFPSHSITILTQHFANLRMMSFEEQAEIYQMTRDYYFEDYKNNELIFKVHPSDMMFYNKLCKGCQVVRERFPAELIPYASSQRSEMLMAISSTGISTLETVYKKSISFNAEYEKSFHFNHKYYFALKLAEMMQGNVYALNVNQTQLEHMRILSDIGFSKDIHYCKNLPSDENAIIIIGDGFTDAAIDRENMTLYLENISSHATVIFLNTDDEFIFYNYQIRGLLKKYLVVKYIDVLPIAEEIYAETGVEKVFIFSKEEKIRKDVQHMSYNKNLPNTGVSTRVSDWSDDETKLAVIEGILDATEKRLLYYINRESELLAIINGKGVRQFGA